MVQSAKFSIVRIMRAWLVLLRTRSPTLLGHESRTIVKPWKLKSNGFEVETYFEPFKVKLPWNTPACSSLQTFHGYFATAYLTFHAWSLCLRPFRGAFIQNIPGPFVGSMLNFFNETLFWNLSLGTFSWNVLNILEPLYCFSLSLWVSSDFSSGTFFRIFLKPSPKAWNTNLESSAGQWLVPQTKIGKGKDPKFLPSRKKASVKTPTAALNFDTCK